MCVSWFLFCQEAYGWRVCELVARPMAGVCELIAVLSGGQWLACELIAVLSGGHLFVCVMSWLLFCQEANVWRVCELVAILSEANG